MSEKKPDLYSLLKQFNAIGGMAEIGQSGFCLLMALWLKSNELNWANQFAMTNTELLYRSGYSSEKAMIEKRNRMMQLGYFRYIPPKNRRSCGTYILNFNLLDYFLKHSNIESISNSNNRNSDRNSEGNSEGNSEVSIPHNINKLNKTKQTKHKDIASESAAPSPVKIAIDYYYQKFRAKFGEKPVIDGGKDGALMKKLVETFGETRLKELIDLFFEIDDEFIRNSGYTIGVFKSQINKLITHQAAKKNSAASTSTRASSNVDVYSQFYDLLEEERRNG